MNLPQSRVSSEENGHSLVFRTVPINININTNVTLLPASPVPGGLVGGPRAYQDQCRGFKPHRVHALWGFFLHKKLKSGKRESVS